jgi:hypothetical protein
MRHMPSYQCGLIAILLLFGDIANYGFIAVFRCGIIADFSSCGIIADLLWHYCHIPTPLGSGCSFNEAVRGQSCLVYVAAYRDLMLLWRADLLILLRN